MSENTTPTKVKATSIAWATSDYSIGVVMRGIKSGDDALVVENVAFSNHEAMDKQGWVRVGMATIEVEIAPVDELQNHQLATLMAQLEKERADTQMRQNAILDRISKLQAIGFSPYEGAPVPDSSDECPF